ncbi:MAG TPA: DsbA family protein [Gemmatimonadaceae bacterium]|nr:DsbA family protein [Gemmatimonadaceae bacterium]
MQKGAVMLNLDVRSRGIATMIGFAVVAASTACKDSSATPRQPAAVQQGAAAATVPEVFGTIGDEKITLAEVRTKAGDDLDKLEMQYQMAKSRIIGAALDSIIRQRMVGEEAQKKGKSIDELIAAEAPGGIEPTDVDIQAWYKENQARLSGRPLDQIRSQIADMLRAQRKQEATKKLDERLRTERKVAITYQPYRLQFNNEGAAEFGKKDAPITLVEFSDFQCPYCERMYPVLKQVEQKYGDKVRIIYRQYPLNSIHPFAQKAAEASLCANEQGKFWQMHDAMFGDQKKLAVADLKQTAQRLGMSGKKFDSCIDSGKYVEQIQNDSKEALRSGVTGTPAVFVNGIVIDGGAVPFDVVAAAIDKELQRIGLAAK